MKGRVPSESRNLGVYDHQVHYLKAGTGLPVVLLHGGASTSADWTETMSALSLRYTLFAPDMIGFVQSNAERSGYYYSDFIQSIIEFIEALGLRSLALVGHSLGGRIGLEVALRQQEIVKKLVLVDSAGFGRVSRPGNLLLTMFWAMRKLLGQPQPYPTFLPEEGADPNCVHFEQLPGLRVPTLIVWKRHDPYLPLSLARRARELIPGSRLAVVSGYGHAPHLHDVKTFNRLLLDFLEHG